MAYDEVLAERVRSILDERDDLAEKKMFGGLSFLIAGNMAVAVSGKGGLMVRLDPTDTEQALQERAVSRIQMGDRAMKGWLYVEATALADDSVLAEWVDRGVTFASTLPPK